MDGRKNAANPAGVDDGKWGLNQVALADAAAINQVIAEQIQELELMAVERGMLGNELVNRARNRVRENSPESRCRECAE